MGWGCKSAVVCLVRGARGWESKSAFGFPLSAGNDEKTAMMACSNTRFSWHRIYLNIYQTIDTRRWLLAVRVLNGVAKP